MCVCREEFIPTYLHWYISMCKLLHHVSTDTRHQAVHTTAILCKLLVSLCKVRANCTVLFTNCSTVLCTGQKCIKYVKPNIQNSIPSVGPMVYQPLSVQSFLRMWKKRVRKQIFVEFCILYIIHLHMMAHCILSYS